MSQLIVVVISVALKAVSTGAMGMHSPQLGSKDHTNPMHPSNRTTTKLQQGRSFLFWAPHSINNLPPKTVDQLHFRSQIKREHIFCTASTLGAGVAQHFFF